MNTGVQLFLSILSYGKAFRVVDKYKLWTLLILPALLSLAIAVLVTVMAWITAGDIVLYITQKYGFRDFDTKIGNIIELIISVFIWSITLFLYFKIYRYLALIILSPVFVNISNILHEKIDGKSEKMDIWAYCFCSIRGIKLAIRNFILEILVTIVLIILSILMVWILPVIPIVIMILESYFFGMVMMDYRYEMDGLSVKESLEKIRNNAGIAIGNGLMFNLIILFPVLGFILGPTLALVAARAAIDEQQNLKFYVNPIHKPI